METVHAVQSHEALYARNGLQFLPFNTLYQLAADPLAAQADRMLLVPDLLGYWLTGVAVTERTNASTTGLLDVRTGEWDRELIDLLGLPAGLFGDLVDPGTVVGPVLSSRGRHLGAPGLTVTTVGSHDTASAVVGVPMASDHAAYISCGTWGLVGVELPAPVLTDAAREANFTNEGGVDGRVRFLTNVMGLWLLSETIRGWERTGQSAPLATLLAEAAAVTAPVPVFDVQDPRFLPPGDMPGRIRSWCAEHDVAAAGRPRRHGAQHPREPGRGVRDQRARGRRAVRAHGRRGPRRRWRCPQRAALPAHRRPLRAAGAGRAGRGHRAGQRAGAGPHRGRRTR